MSSAAGNSAGSEGRTAVSGELVAALRQALGPASVIADSDELIVYECDGFTVPRARPLAVVFPTTTEEAGLLLYLPGASDPG